MNALDIRPEIIPGHVNSTGRLPESVTAAEITSALGFAPQYDCPRCALVSWHFTADGSPCIVWASRVLNGWAVYDPAGALAGFDWKGGAA